MSNEENIKQVWQTPEIVDLDMDKTSGKGVEFSSEITAYAGVS